MTQKVSTIDVARFQNTALFSITISTWGNRAKVGNPAALTAYLAEVAKVDGNTNGAPAIEGSTNTKRVSATKKLVKSEALDALLERLRKAKKDCLQLCMPSNIRKGIFVASLEALNGNPSPVAQINAIIAEAEAEIRRDYIPEFRIAYPVAVENAKLSPIKLKEGMSNEYELDERGGLGPLFDAGDYPRISDGNPDSDLDADELPLDVDAVANCFGLKWNWLALTVPEGLPPELRAQESEKLHQQFEDAATEIRSALRTMFNDLITHAADTLKTGPDEKKKKFHDTLTGNMAAFFDTFSAKNIMGDSDLAAIVAQAKAIMTQEDGTFVAPDTLRKDDSVRELTANKLDEIKKALAPLVTECQTRSFDFSQD